jgi:glucose/arabinose dehydrogenase
MSTFHPHSSPAGIVFLSADAYPPPFRGSFFVVRFGNLLKRDRDSGFDLLMVRPQKDDPRSVAVTTLLSPLARPIDILEWSPGRLLIAEYSRGTTFASGLGPPGRILELSLTHK